MTDYSELLDAGLVKKGSFARRQVTGCLKIAKRDLKTALTVIDTSPEWAFNIAYNAMHQAGRAFMFHCGYRATGERHHATVIRFLQIALGNEFEDVLALLDRMRRKRNRATYEVVGTISRTEAGEAISSAKEFVAEIAERVKKDGT